MAKEKKQPKDTKDGVLSKDAETILIGLMLSLVALIGLLNRGPIGEFLSYCMVYLFGVFYFIAFLIALFFGLYLILKRQMYRVKIDTTMLGVILLFLGVMISASYHPDGNDIMLNNVFSTYADKMNVISDGGVLIRNMALVDTTCGGLVGFFLAALLNTTITSIGTMVVSLILMTVGLALFLKVPFSKYLSWRKAHKEKKKLRKEQEENRKKEEQEQEEAFQKEEEEMEEEEVPIYTAKGTTSNQANKARFIFEEPEEEKTPTYLVDDIEEERKAPAMSSNTTTSVFEPTEEIEEDETVEEEIKEEPVVEKEEPLISTEHVQVSTPTASKVTFKIEDPVPAPIKVVGERKPALRKEKTPYVYPSLDLLNVYENAHVDEENDRVSKERQEAINHIFEDLGIGATISGYKVGPAVTRFDVLMNRDVSVNNILKNITDVSIRLGGVRARFQKVVRGKITSGLELPNARSVTVSLKECLAPYVGDPKKKYFVPFGKDITGDVLGMNVGDYPHLLVAGATGSGKSVFMHCLIMSLLMKTSPEELRILLIDPKRVEMSKYRDEPHLICPIVSDYSESKVAMNRLVQEMERRYQLFEDACVSKISQYNEYAEEEGLEPLPLIVVIIDEYADLVENCKDIASPVVKIAAKSRACGIHMVISTQRPSVNVITGVIKANLPTRVALRVASYTDSQTILGEAGAEKLLGYGDMLVDSQEFSDDGFTRLQCPFVDNKEIKRVVEFLKEHYETHYDPKFLDLVDRSAAGPSFGGTKPKERDERFEEVKAFVMNLDEVSISEIMRRLALGFPKAARIMDQLEDAGIVSKASGSSSKRKVLIHNQSAQDEGETTDDSKQEG